MIYDVTIFRRTQALVGRLYVKIFSVYEIEKETGWDIWQDHKPVSLALMWLSPLSVFLASSLMCVVPGTSQIIALM